MKQNLKLEELKYLRLEKKMELSEMIKVMLQELSYKE